MYAKQEFYQESYISSPCTLFLMNSDFADPMGQQAASVDKSTCLMMCIQSLNPTVVGDNQFLKVVI